LPMLSRFSTKIAGKEFAATSDFARESPGMVRNEQHSSRTEILLSYVRL
jgi:hypothetical protein